MNNKTRLYWEDCLFLLTAAFFFVGCIASAHRSGKTLDPGQFSLSASYLCAENWDEPSDDPVQLIAYDTRFGVKRGLDMGILHTWDVTSNNDNLFATIWGDFKLQLTNRGNATGKPIVSLGLMKGYVYDDRVERHITSLPLTLSIPLSETVTPYLGYRHELVGEDFLPSDLNDPRSTFLAGVEVHLRKTEAHQWTPKLGLCVGTFNSLEGGEGDRAVLLNFGFTLDLPRKVR